MTRRKGPTAVDGIEAWDAAGRELRDADPERFRRVLAVARAYVAQYKNPDEPDEVFASRLVEMSGRIGRA